MIKEQIKTGDKVSFHTDLLNWMGDMTGVVKNESKLHYTINCDGLTVIVNKNKVKLLNTTND